MILTLLAINGAASGVFILCTVCWPRAVFGIFLSEPEALDMAVTYVPVAVVSFIGSIIRPSMLSLINGSGNSRLNLAVALLDGVIVRIGLALLLGLCFHLGSLRLLVWQCLCGLGALLRWDDLLFQWQLEAEWPVA